MAKIPYVELPQVAPSGRGAPMPQQQAVGGFGALTQGVQQFGTGLGNTLEKAASEYDRRVKESQDKARAAEVAEAETEWNTHRTATKYGRQATGDGRRDAIEGAFQGESVEQKGYFNRQGDDAFQAAPATFESIEKRRQELADDMTDEEAKRLFLERTRGQLDDDRNTIEAFAGKQRTVADLATLAGRKSAAIDAIQANPNNLTEVQRQTELLEEPIAKLGLSGVDKAERVKEWRREAAVAQVAAQLNGPLKDWQSAEATLNNKRDVIGEKAAEHLQTRVDQLKASQGAEATASGIVKASTRSDGSVDERKVLDKLLEVPDEKRAKVAEAIAPLRLQARQAYDAETERLMSRAQASYNKNGWHGMPDELKDALNGRKDDPRGPKLYDALKHADERELDRLERKSRIRANDAAALREQTQIDNIAKDQWSKQLDTDLAGADLQRFLLEHKGISDDIPAHLEKMQAHQQMLHDKGLKENEKQFTVETMAALKNFEPRAGGDKESQAKLRQWKQRKEAEAIREYAELVKKNKGEKPDPEQVNKAKARIIARTQPQNDESAEAAGDAIVEVTTNPSVPPKTSAMVTIVGPNGQKGRAPEAGLDAWLASHPGWKRQ